MNKTTYLLTGAAGFLGSNISRSLIAQGQKVRALVLDGDPAAKSIPDGVEIVPGDLLDPDSLERFFTVPAGEDMIVLHAASFVTVVPDWNEKVYAVNVTGTKNIVDLCLLHNVKKLVYVSSTGAVPELPHGTKIKEPERLDPDLVPGCYQKTKAMATQIVLDAVQTYGLDASVIYPSGICGPNDYGYSFVSQFITDYARGKLPAGINGSFNSVDVRDLADGVIACATKGKKGEGYILSNCFVTIRELFDSIHKYAESPEVKIMLPIPLARFMARIAEAASKITGKPAILTTFSIHNLARNNDFDCSKAVRDLGYKCRPFDETIRDTVKWLISEGKIEASYENIGRGDLKLGVLRLSAEENRA